MRKITEDAIRAFRNNKHFKRDNTQVICVKQSWKILENRRLVLHGHIIAEMDNNGNLFIDSCGYMTVTTKERLNGFPSVNIIQRDFEWFLNGERWDGGLIRVA